MKKIIVAVSGGVDSVVMLHQLVQQGAGVRGRVSAALTPIPNPQPPKLIVTHIDHGLRSDSPADARFVAALTECYGLEFEQTRLELGDRSEAAARTRRWQFLQEVKEKYQADAIATAHHRDDVIETMIINLLRGTNRNGLTSLRARSGILRPLLSYSKQDIYSYAIENNLEWAEDSTNCSDQYLRNRIRHYLVPALSSEQRDIFLKIYDNLIQTNQELNRSLKQAAQTLATRQADRFRIETQHINQLPDSIQRELFATWWQQLMGSPPPDSLQLERMVAAIGEPKTGNRYQMANGVRLKINRGDFELLVNDD